MSCESDKEALYPHIQAYGPGCYDAIPPQPQQVVVIQQQPDCHSALPIVGHDGIPLDEYQVGMWQCCRSPGNCLLAWCCPCILGCFIAGKLDENSCFHLCWGIYPYSLRFRTLVGIKQSMCSEACVFHCCPCQSALRLMNEMEEREFQIHRC